MSLLHWWNFDNNHRDLITGKELYSSDPVFAKSEGKNVVNATRTKIYVPELDGRLGFAFIIRARVDSEECTTHWSNIINIHAHDYLIDKDFNFRFDNDRATDHINNCMFFHDNSGGHILTNQAWNEELQKYTENKRLTSISFNTLYNQWNTYVMTSDGEKMDIYANGKRIVRALVNKSAILNGIIDAASIKGILISDLKIYDSYLSEKEVVENCKDLLIHYSFDSYGIALKPSILRDIRPGGQMTKRNNALFSSGENKDTYFYLDLKEPLIEGQRYTVSCCADVANGYFQFGLGGQASADPHLFIYNGFNTCTFICNSKLATKTSILFDDIKRVLSPSKFYFFRVEKEDNVLLNDVPYNIKGTLHNVEIKRDAGIGQYSAYFNGESSYIETEYKYQSWLENEAKSISFWIKPEDAVGRQIMGTTAYSWIILRTNSGQIRFNCWDKTGNHSNKLNFSSTTLTPLNEWSQIVVTWNVDKTISLYVNGNKESGGMQITNTINMSRDVPLNIGGNIYGWGYKSYFKGYIDDFRLYHTCLTNDQVRQSYEAKAMLDNNNKIFTKEFIEEEVPHIKINDKATIIAKEFIEEGNISLSDKISCNEIVEN